ncbi:MAG: ferritin [Candidatus Bathyarchaeia archaeon]|nr:ferritin [Candidatus Bathyarchaeota archaeon]
MIKDKVQEALNKQINRELYSAYLYLSMAAYFESINLKGFAHWMRIQAREEVGHAMKLYDHLVERGGRVGLQSIDAPPREWKSPLEVFEEVYRHERTVSQMIDDLVNLARSEGDNAAEVFLQWFVKEQVEEEASALEILERLKLVGEGGQALFMIDRELAKREAEQD